MIVMDIFPKGGKMPVFRVNKTKDYTVMSNVHFRDRRLSLKAKGLLSLMLSLPDDWDFSIKGLISICTENKASIRSALGELKTFGYLEIVKINPDKSTTGKIEYIYNIYENPINQDADLKQYTEKQYTEKQYTENQYTEKQYTENQYTENQYTEKQYTENQPQLNTNKSNTKELNTNKEKTNKSSTKEEKKKREKKKPIRRDVYFPLDEKLDNTFKEYVVMREEIKKPFKTESAIDKSIEKLKRLSGGDNDIAILILNESIANEWQGLFPLKDNIKSFQPLQNKKAKETEEFYDMAAGWAQKGD